MSGAANYASYAALADPRAGPEVDMLATRRARDTITVTGYDTAG